MEDCGRSEFELSVSDCDFFAYGHPSDLCDIFSIQKRAYQKINIEKHRIDSDVGHKHYFNGIILYLQLRMVRYL